MSFSPEAVERMSASGHWRTVTPGEVGGARVGIRRDGGYFPLGPGGHSNATRLNFIAARGDIVARAAAAGVSISTARRWENSMRDRGAIERRPHGGGATRLLSNEEAEQLAWYNVWDPSAYQDESAAYVATVRGTHPSQPTVSRKLRQMGFRRLRANTRTLGGPTAESRSQHYHPCSFGLKRVFAGRIARAVPLGTAPARRFRRPDTANHRRRRGGIGRRLSS